MQFSLRTTLSTTLIVVTIMAATPLSRAQQAPPRDSNAAQAPSRVGTAAIAGVVIDGLSQQPIRRVIVVVAEQGGTSSGRVAVTGEDGRFALPNLPAGRYRVTATKAAYLATAHGVNKPMRPGAAPTGSAVALTDGQQMTDLTLRMTRGSVVTGSVRDADGRPVRGASVQLLYSLRATLTGDRSFSTVPSGSALTDARGSYRIFGVPPGEYIPSASLAGLAIGDLETTTEVDVQRITDMIAARSGGSAASSASLAANAAVQTTARRPTYGYAPIYHPGTTTLANATPITLAPGEERAGVDFQLQLVPQSRVSGVVTGTDGRPAAGIFVRVSSAAPFASGPFVTWLTTGTDPQGQFLIRAVPAGDYVLEIRPGGPRAPGAPPLTSWARANVSVAPGVDARVAVTLQPGRTVSGQVTVDTASTGAPDFTRIRVALMNRDGLTSPAVIGADGKFTIAGVLPDAYRLTVSVPAASPGAAAWFAKIGTVGGKDAMDAMVDLAEDVSGASVVLTSKVSEVSGAILDAVGRPATEYFIIIFPADQKLWSWQSRRIQQMRPATDGRFSFKNLPAGEYLIGAVTDVEANQWFEPAFLTELLGASVKLSLGDGEKKVQDIRLR